ncbi:MAG TPA: hypothetical protein VL403_03350, partial [Candidatus Kryptonia bacterium]|nr:hypothetical protein [Candidatus Kryptonia bacterium]
MGGGSASYFPPHASVQKRTIQMTSTPEQLKDEAVGDWCGFKGAAYHLTVAVWLLLTDRASEAEFYAGNDLLAHPV